MELHVQLYPIGEEVLLLADRESGVTKNILVVDDEPSIGRAFKRLLHRDADVVAVTTIEEGVRLVLEREFDAIFCDVHLRGGTGREFFRRVARERPGMEGRIVFVTGGLYSAEEEDFFEGIDNPLLWKPFDRASAVEAIHQVSGDQ